MIGLESEDRVQQVDLAVQSKALKSLIGARRNSSRLITDNSVENDCDQDDKRDYSKDYLKLTRIEYQTVEQQFKDEIEQLERPEEFLVETLNAQSVNSMYQDELSVSERIELFFESPVPSLHFGASNEDSYLFDGVLLEYNLRKLVGARTGGSILDFIGLPETNTCMNLLEMEANFLRNPLDPLVHKERGKIMTWGQKADCLSNLWNESVQELVSVLISNEKKEYLKSGLYSKAKPRRTTAFYSDFGFEFPLPLETGLEFMDTERDFEVGLPILFYLEEIGGIEKITGQDCDVQPSKFKKIKKSLELLKLDIFVDRKPENNVIQYPCQCPSDGNCGVQCLNRCMCIECSDNCPSGENCTNKQFQKSDVSPYIQNIKVQAYPGRGFGLETNVLIPKDSFILEYLGEIITTETLMKRMETIYKNERHYYVMTYSKDEVIDGSRKGTIARFVNHSCDPNCRIEKWFYILNRNVLGEWRVGIFANRNIEPGEEITYDYKFESFGQMQKCGCNAPNCRGYIGMKKNGVVIETKKRPKKAESKLQPVKDVRVVPAKIMPEMILEEGTKRASAKKALANSKKQSVVIARARGESIYLKNRSKPRPITCVRKLLMERGLPYVGRNLKATKRVIAGKRKSIDTVVKEMHLENALNFEPPTLLITKQKSFPLFTDFDESAGLAELILTGEKVCTSILKRNLRNGGALPFHPTGIKNTVRKSLDMVFDPMPNTPFQTSLAEEATRSSSALPVPVPVPFGSDIGKPMDKVNDFAAIQLGASVLESAPSKKREADIMLELNDDKTVTDFTNENLASVAQDPFNDIAKKART